MASIKSQMTLNDGMSAVLKRITYALNTTLHCFEQVQEASGQAIDTELIKSAHLELAQANNQIQVMEDYYKKAAQEEEKLNQGIREGTSAADGMLGKITAMVAAYASISGIKGFITDSLEAADVQIGAQVQLKTVMGNMGTLDYYDQMLDKAADIQGRGIYGDEAMIAGTAEFATYFEDANAILAMMDTLTDYAMGMSGGGALDTTAMVDYATGLGKIMSGSYDAMTKKGFEFSDAQKAIIEGTATEAQIVAELGEEYLSMSQDMQAAAAINAVIAEGWGGLYETMSNTPEGKLIQLNNTLGDIKENVGAGIYPAVVSFVDVIRGNTPQIEAAAMGLATMLGFVITLLTGMVEGASAFGTAVADNWGWIGPIIYGVVAALTAYVAVLGVYNAVQAVTNGLKAAAAFQETVHAAATAMATGATFAETAAQWGLNAALLACPVTWIILAIIALIAVIYAVVGAINHFAGTSVSATGIIAGAFAVLGAHIINTFVVPVWNQFAAIANFFGNVFNDPVAAVKVLFYDMALTVIGYISNMAHAIEDLINKIPGVTVDITSGLDNFYAGLEKAQQAVKDESGWVEYVQKMDFIDYGDAATAGYAFGQGVEDKVGSFFDGFSYEPGTIEGYANSGFDGFMMNGLANDVGTIADNTGGMADALDVSGEELKYLRDIAERDAINRFTTAEVKIDMTGMTNKIDGGADLDGVIRELTDGFSEALVTAAEGVHE